MKVTLIVKHIEYVSAEIEVSDYAGDDIKDNIKWYEQVKYGMSAEDAFYIAKEANDNKVENVFEIDVANIEEL